MSAEPFAALVFGGTSELPSSVAFILSARAGPANATVAPNPSITSMVLVFDMVLSLLTLVVCQLQTMKMRFYSRNRKERSKFSASLWRRYGPYYSAGQVVDDGWVNAATNSSADCHSRGSSGLGALLVANRCPAHVRGQGASASG